MGTSMEIEINEDGSVVISVEINSEKVVQKIPPERMAWLLKMWAKNRRVKKYLDNILPSEDP